MEFSDQALAGENNPSHPTGEEELRIPNKQLRERKERNDKDERRLLPELQEIIEGFALSTKRSRTC
jgi:hypothetical protein